MSESPVGFGPAEEDAPAPEQSREPAPPRPLASPVPVTFSSFCPATLSPAPVVWLDSFAYGGFQWPRLRRRPPPRDAGGKPAGSDNSGEGARRGILGVRLPYPRPSPLLQGSKTPLTYAQSEGRNAAAALLQADPRVAAALAAAAAGKA